MKYSSLLSLQNENRQTGSTPRPPESISREIGVNGPPGKRYTNQPESWAFYIHEGKTNRGRLAHQRVVATINTPKHLGGSDTPNVLT